MKCPLSNYILEKDDADNEMLVTDCLKEECAWWDKTSDRCGILTIGHTLKAIMVDVNSIVEKMPHEEQFRR